ncbi:RagB/SusD family nutrient uptake outer membrane protein [Dyadobacter frigoris]|uniref:RagB/SusD family nutrient uptake outer membrane protein n=1 Tax=Dyadobacter frigoris TaxID=2576211 RepID=A0A4U6CUN1_9BACT|nr:RagB/SusD family nutrient uptake outer membrane protein [Dyadobacter frigoris]TKT87976.1 RagB/SusD family nutrient uptake outer membrane protein [Dyadobacter frigoris]GLU52873.1 membrane protein [Dyadobacter frigoris]
MKKKLFNYLTIIIVAAVCTVVPSGCKNALDLEPLDRVSDATYWKDANEFKLAASAFYGYLRTFGNGNGDGHTGSDLGPDRGTIARGTNTIVSNDDNYNNAYKWIRNINYLLAKAKDFKSPDQIKISVAEAKFFRAYVYFDKLLTSYGGVILVKDVLTTESAELKAARNTRDETIDFIIGDLEAAIADLPVESEIAAADKGRISKGAAEAFLGRVCLYEGTWQKFRSGNATRYNALLDKAISNNNAVITSNQYSLFKPAVLGDSALKYLFILENQKSNPAGITKSSNQEYILGVRYESNNLLKTIPNQISFSSLGGDASRVMADMYLCNDGLPIDKTTLPFSRATLTSEYKNREHRMRYFMMIPGLPYWQNAVNYHINWDWSAADLAIARIHNAWNGDVTGYSNQYWSAERQVPNGQEGWDYPVIRLAEVYLNYAEALFERNGDISDVDLDKSLNLVRNRVNVSMPKLSNALAKAHNLDMQQEIRRERTVELQAENFRMDDLKRWYIAHIELAKVSLGVRWKGTEFETKYPDSPPPLTADGDVIADPVTERKFSAKNYLIPLPTNQLQLNPNLVQNPGW